MPQDSPKFAPDFDRHWNYNDPAGTERVFRAMLLDAIHPDAKLELQTQIARTLGLQQRFAESHAILDDVEAKLPATNHTVRIRYLLERGRAINSSGEPRRARPFFEQASAMRGNAPDAFVIDALHMLAIVEPDPNAQLALNLRALELAEHSSDRRARKWLASLYNNIGWTQYQRGQYDDALAVFEKAVELRARSGEANGLRIAHYCVGKTLRAMGRLQEAIAIQLRLHAQAEASPDASPDGYVCEEIAECYLAQRDPTKAKPYFQRAYELLAADAWLMKNESARVERLRSLGASGDVT